MRDLKSIKKPEKQKREIQWLKENRKRNIMELLITK